ncbi:MAG: 30S ribosomal protein S25e [Thermoprotei archaeon]|nr:MAG: 30S ribosomal protein S25e [Thermoprotei archaeon]
MGGRKRPTLSQLEKRMRREREAGKKKGKERKTYEMKLTSKGFLTEVSLDQIINEVGKMPYITPYVIASKFGLKISRAKVVLRELEKRSIIIAVDKNRRVPIYVPAQSS